MAAKARLRLDGADPINRGLLGFWPLQEPAGSIAEDISGNGWDARAGTMPVRRSTPLIGKAASFDGSTQYLTTAAPANPGSTVAHTISAWIRPNFSSASNTPGTIIIRGAGVTWGQRIVWNTATTGFYTDNLSAGVGAAFDMTGAVPSFSAGEWHHIAFVYNGGGQWYWDGKPVATNGPLFGAWPSANLAGLSFYIGRNFSADTYWNGELALIRQHVRPLLRNEISRLYRDPWAGTARPVRRAVAVPGTQYTLATDALAYEHTVGDAGLGWGRRLDTEALAYEHAVGDAGFVVRRTLQAEAVAYGYTVPAVALNYYPAQAEGDTHDGFKRRSRRQRALDAAERRRREAAAEEALALRLALEAAMGEAVEAVEEAPAPAAEAVETATKQAARYVPLLAQGPSDDVLQAANEAIVALRSAVAAADRARMLAEDDEEVMMLLRAL